MYADASESRKVTGPIRFFGLPIFPWGMRDIHLSLSSGYSSVIFCVLVAVEKKEDSVSTRGCRCLSLPGETYRDVSM